MTAIVQRVLNSMSYVKSMIKWIIVAGIIGIVGGIVGSFFHKAIDGVTYLRMQNTWIIYLLPIGALAIAGLYRLASSQGKLDTNRVLDSVEGDEKVPFVLLPLIFVSSVITHFVGGSAGREGAALQLGGAIGYKFGKTLRLGSDDMHIVVMAGMSAVFTALFGTPITAAVFAIEVTSVGIMHYGALLPCMIASVAAREIALGLDVSPVAFSPVMLGTVSPELALKLVFHIVLCAVVSVIFCASIKLSEHYSKKLIPNKFIRSFVGGALLLLLTLLVGSRDYNGTGMNVIERALGGTARYEAFAIKILFTAITIAAGFKGGEIVPTFFIGSTFGCALASLMGIPPEVGAAIGFIALFCGVVNCPIASLMLALEVFGADSIILFAIVCALSYVMSGNYGLYKSQKIVFSKLGLGKINVNAQ